MSNHQVPSDLIKNPSGDDHKEQKVIVVSVKDMQSFKIKDIYGNQDGGQPIFTFKPQQLLQSAPGSSIHPIQVTQQVKAPSFQVQPTPVQKITPTQYVIRTQHPLATASIAPKVTTQQIIKQQHQQPLLSFVVSNAGHDAPKLISSQVTIQNKQPEYQTIKTPSTSIQIAKKVVATPSQIVLNPQQKTMQVVQAVPKTLTIAQKSIHQQQTMPSTFKLINKEIRQIPIVQAQQPQIFIKTQPQSVQQSQNAWKTKIITLPSPTTKPKAAPPKIISTFAEMPALAPIQRKIAPQPAPVEKIEADSSKDEEVDEPHFEMIDNEEYLNVKRIIEGDDDMNGIKLTEKEKITHDDEEEEEEEEEEENETMQSENEQQEVLSSDSLLCDEQIASISPEVSPNDKEKEDEKAQTPVQANSDVKYKTMATDVVKKTLNLDMPQSGSDEKIQLRIEVEEEDDSVISDDTNVSKNIAADNDDESLHSKSEISIIGSGEKTLKRSRKTKNPTVNPNLGLPYKPTMAQAGNSRKKKAEKKLELEHDFHDPLNKIQWEDGIGGMNNCNKLFGFDDFGLVEVVNKKDARAKVNCEPFDQSNFKFRKILDPQDQFCCVVCSKTGTVRDFFSPECCSEACMAITKRKAFDYGARDEQHDSGQSSPTTDAKRVAHEGELVPLQQLQTFLLQQQLPGGKKIAKNFKPRSLSIPAETTTSDNFSWKTYLNAKSVPAPPELFKNYRQQQTKNPFKVGMKLEAIDPKNQNLFCVCSVDERIGHRIKLHFDGYPSTFDFWVDVGSKNIFPIDFCRITKRKLELPPKWPNKNFDWTEYLDAQNSAGALRNMFPHLSQIEADSSMVRVGMKLEALKDDAWYAATVVDILNGRILVEFDDQKEYAWFDFKSPYIGPCNGHKTDEETSTFRPPIGTPDSFSWDTYLKSTNSEEVPDEFFAMYDPIKNEFETGMKLEIVDRANPQLIRPGTILAHDDYKIHVNYDGFTLNFAYWLDYDSEEIYPINYCKQTGHPIEFPARNNQSALCQTTGCRGIGNGIYPDRAFHEKSGECPYRPHCWKKYIEGDDTNRLDYKAQAVKRNKVQKENRSVEKRPSLLRPKKEVKEEMERSASISTFEENYEEPPVDQQVVQKRARKRKSQPDTDDSATDGKIRVVENFLESYGPQMNYTFRLWQENSKVLDRATVGDDSLTENPLKWSVDDVCSYLIKFCDEETSAKFYAQQVDGEALLSLHQNDLRDLMKIKMGPAIKINNRIMHLRSEVVAKFLDI